MPGGGWMVFRVFGSPVAAQTMFVSEGAIASMPMEMIGLSSKTGRQVTPLFVVFQMPPAAAATNIVFDGLGMPTTSDSRPMKFAGPTVRQRKPATIAESSVCDEATRALRSSAVAAASESRRRSCMDIPAERRGGGAITGQANEVAEEVPPSEVEPTTARVDSIVEAKCPEPLSCLARASRSKSASIRRHHSKPVRHS